MSNIIIILDGVELPVPTTMTENPTPLETTNQTLDGTIYTDFINIHRSWDVTWASLCEADYDTIRGIFDSQYSLKSYPLLTISYYGVISLPVKLDINSREIFWDGNMIKGIQIKLTEQYSIS